MPAGGYRKGIEERNRQLPKNPKWRAAMKARGAAQAKDPAWRAANLAAMRKLAKDPAWLAQNAARLRKQSKNPAWRKAIAAANRKRALDPNFRKRISEALTRTVAWYEEHSRRTNKGCLIYKVAAENSMARTLYIRRHGPLPAGICVLHTCDVPQCIEDAHHFTGTKKDNAQDALKKGRLKYPDNTGLKYGPQSVAARFKKSEASFKMWEQRRRNGASGRIRKGEKIKQREAARR